MKRMRLMILLTLSLLTAGTTYAKKVGTGQTIVVSRFELAEGVRLPVEYRSQLAHALGEQLSRKGFHVVRASDGRSMADGALLLSGTVDRFDAGSRATRYLVGFGAGATKLKARITLTDAQGRTLVNSDVKGQVRAGLLGGASVGAVTSLARGIAKRVAKQVR